MLRGHRTQGAYTDLTDETNQPEPQPEDPSLAAAEAPHAADEPAEMTAEMPPLDVPVEPIVAEPEPTPEPMMAEAEAAAKGPSH